MIMNTESGMNDATRILQRSARLVKSWGQAKLQNGKNLSAALTINGIQLWEAVVSDLAHLYVPNAIWQKSTPSFFSRKIRPTLTSIKHTVLNKIDAQKYSKVSINWPSEPVCLFLANSSYIYCDVLKPVVDCMKDKKILYPIVITDQKSIQDKSEGVQYIWQYWNDEVDDFARYLNKMLKKVVKRILKDDELPRIIQDQGRSLWPNLKHVFNWLFQVYLPFLIPQAAIAKHILENYRPALVISPDVNDPRTRFYCLLGARMGIESLEIQMGEYDESAVEWQFFVASRLAVWGRNSYDVLLDHGVPGERMVITGSPRHDKMKYLNDKEKAQIRSKLGVPDGCLMVLFASVYEEGGAEVFKNPEYPNVIAEMKDAIFQAANQVDGMCLVVKPHPLENVEKTKKQARKNRNILFADQSADINDMIRACDVFMAVTGSTTVTDALVANKLTIIPVFPGWIWSDQFVKSGAILAPRSAEEVAHCLRMIVDEDSRARIQADLQPALHRFLHKWFFKVDGQASARIKKLALQMASLGK